jgi:hypothetical protein
MECRQLIGAAMLAAWTAMAAMPVLAAPLDLITEDEARLPSAYGETKRAGLTRGPSISINSPAGVTRKDALDLKVDFKARGGAAIDPKSVKLTYMKSPAVSLTERVKPFVTADGIVMEKARVPAGEHQLKLEVTDSEGRVSSKLINFKAE